MDTIDKIVLGAVLFALIAIALVIVVVNDSRGSEIHTALFCKEQNGVIVCIER